jgi:hypothetical protein
MGKNQMNVAINKKNCFKKVHYEKKLVPTFNF